MEDGEEDVVVDEHVKGSWKGDEEEDGAAVSLREDDCKKAPNIESQCNGPDPGFPVG